MRYFIVMTLLFLPILQGEEKKIELFANYPVTPDFLNRALQERNIPAHVVISDMKHYDDALLIDKSRLGKFLRALFLDISPPVKVSEDLSHIVFWNITRKYSHKRHLSKLPKEKMVLFMWEPPSVLQEMYSPHILSLFSKVYTWNDDLIDNKTFFRMYYPVLRPMIQKIPRFEEKKLCTLVCSNISSAHPDELYSERKNTIAYFESLGSPDFEFYGRKWDAREHPLFRGPILGNDLSADKIKVIQHYRFTICYENMHRIKGYISEKIFDCFAAASVPVYWGSSNIDQYIPSDCFIDRRHFSTLEELHAFLKNMGKEEYEGYLARIKAFLSSEQAQLFSMARFEKTFCDAVSGNVSN